jgi:hypothetical protein
MENEIQAPVCNVPKSLEAGVEILVLVWHPSDRRRILSMSSVYPLGSG